METSNKTRHISDSILTEILARLPLRSISRFKSVCKTWRSTFKSVYFRRLFVSVHQKYSSSSSWSLMYRGRELVNSHRYKTWDLPKSLASYIPNLDTDNSYWDYKLTCSNGLVLIEGNYLKCFFVGNPILQQWIQIPPPTQCLDLSSGFVTRVDEDGVVLSFKVIRIAIVEHRREDLLTCFGLYIYSSETGLWTYKKLHFLYYYVDIDPLFSLNGTLYLSTSTCFDDQFLELVAHDFYDEAELSRFIPLPNPNVNQHPDLRRALTTSRGNVIYIQTLDHGKGDNSSKVWRLSNDDCWQLLWEICPRSDLSYYTPLAMHPYDRDIIFLCNQRNFGLVSFNLRTRDYKVLEDVLKQDSGNDQDCFVNQAYWEKFMGEIFGPSSNEVPVVLFQLVLPRWMESMPCPPQAEMFDTTSLVSRIKGQTISFDLRT